MFTFHTTIVFIMLTINLYFFFKMMCSFQKRHECFVFEIYRLEKQKKKQFVANLIGFNGRPSNSSRSGQLTSCYLTAWNQPKPLGINTRIFYSVYSFAVMRLHSHGFERRSLRLGHHTAYQKHCMVKRVLLSKASYGQIYSTVKSNTCSNASNCQKHRMVKRATLSKAAYGQLQPSIKSTALSNRHIVKCVTWSNEPHGQTHQINCQSIANNVPHCQKRRIWSNVAHCQKHQMVKRVIW